MENVLSHTAVQMALAILLLPLGAFCVQIWIGHALPRKGDWLPTAAMGLCLALALCLFFGWFIPNELNPHAGGQVIDGTVFKFFSMGPGAETVADQGALNRGDQSLHLAFGVRLDNLTLIMLVVVTLVSFLVHLYSMGYMHGEVRYERFFAFLALFSFSMLGLVLSNSLLFTFIFWELVGLCSYFLIGFYFEKKSAAQACVKAFMTTRVGDLGFFMAILIIYKMVGTTHYGAIFASLQDGTWLGAGGQVSVLLAITGILLFFGPVGKSAQFPLHVWLPDAMEGPTPVSALIHAATMVAAGVYLVARMFPFMAGPAFFTGGDYLANSTPLLFIAITGGITALFAATIALVQNDIKKVLAYSTVSQLGFMMLGIGTGSLVAGMFHLWTHAYFKACLFLGSGSVIHAVHSNEMEDMGGLKSKMPITYATMLIATIAIAGVPFFSGFVSKDAILAGALAYGMHAKSLVHVIPFALGMIAAVLTAFYMFRMMFLTFHGKPNDQEAYDHAHESPWTMCIPLIVLAVLSTFVGSGGFTGKWFNDRLDPAALGYRIAPQDISDGAHAALPARTLVAAKKGGAHTTTPEQDWVHTKHDVHVPMMGLSILAALFGIGLSYVVFIQMRHKDLVGEKGFLASYKKVLVNLYYVDWFYYKVILSGLFVVKEVCYLVDKYLVDGLVNLCGWAAKGLSHLCGWIDYNGVDGAVRGTSLSVLYAGRNIRRIQTGRLQEYVYMTVILLGFIFIGWVCVVEIMK